MLYPRRGGYHHRVHREVYIARTLRIGTLGDCAERTEQSESQADLADRYHARAGHTEPRQLQCNREEQHCDTSSSVKYLYVRIPRYRAFVPEVSGYDSSCPGCICDGTSDR